MFCKVSWVAELTITVRSEECCYIAWRWRGPCEGQGSWGLAPLILNLDKVRGQRLIQYAFIRTKRHRFTWNRMLAGPPRAAPKAGEKRLLLCRGCPVPSLLLIFFKYKELLAPDWIPSLVDRPLSAFGECLFLRTSMQIYQICCEISKMFDIACPSRVSRTGV